MANVKKSPDDFGNLLGKWTERLTRTYVQGLIRKLTKNQVEDMIPDEARRNVAIEPQSDGTLLVIVRDRPDAAALLQAVCDADWEEVQVAMRLEADREVGARH